MSEVSHPVHTLVWVCPVCMCMWVHLCVVVYVCVHTCVSSPLYELLVEAPPQGTGL